MTSKSIILQNILIIYIYRFIEDINKNNVQTVLIGGEAAEFVGSDFEDESKLDVMKMIEKSEQLTEEYDKIMKNNHSNLPLN